MYKVLVIDRSPAFHKYIERTIGKHLKVEFKYVRNCDEAMAFLQTELPVLILLEIDFKPAKPIEFFKNIRADEAYEKTPVIILTTRPNDQAPKLADPLGVDGYIFKDVTDVSDFLDKIKTTLVKHRISF